MTSLHSLLGTLYEGAETGRDFVVRRWASMGCGRREQEGDPERWDSGFLGIRNETIGGSSTTNGKMGLNRVQNTAPPRSGFESHHPHGSSHK